MSLRSSSWWSRIKATAVLGFLGALTACGGSTYEEFQPQRILSFGDEYSYIESNTGVSNRKYTVNAFNAAGQLDCSVYPLWNQVVLKEYGYAFPQCNPSGVDSSHAVLYAQPGATSVSGFSQQIDTYVNAGGFKTGDMALVLFGSNDVKALYAQYPARTADDLKAQAYKVGVSYSEQIKRLQNMGIVVVTLTTPDVGIAPYGKAMEASKAGSAQLLQDLNSEFSRGWRSNVDNDGRKMAITLTENIIRRIVTNSSNNYGAYTIDKGACQDGLSSLNCTTNTLRADVSTENLDFYTIYHT